MSFKEFLQSELNEATAEIQVTDQQDSLKQLKALGIKAKPGKRNDEVSVDLKDKKKLKAWMLDSGWEMEDLEELYPEVL